MKGHGQFEAASEYVGVGRGKGKITCYNNHSLGKDFPNVML
jgi:hypothetical protein